MKASAKKTRAYSQEMARLTNARKNRKTTTTPRDAIPDGMTVTCSSFIRGPVKQPRIGGTASDMQAEAMT